MKKIIVSYACVSIFALFCVPCKANQVDNLEELILSKRSKKNLHLINSWEEYQEVSKLHYHVLPQEGIRDADKISVLPGQPHDGVNFELNFDQYSGHVTVDPVAGRALFYYFVESPDNSSSKPLVLWLNGGPGCSSFGYGALQELGPFRVNSNGKTLFHNKYAWNNVANVLFLESPAGVGFSYSNTSSDYEREDDKFTANDAYVFLINWLERFPQYKSRDFFITGESYAGHYAPQLAYTILVHNKLNNHTIINLKGIAMGNPFVDFGTTFKGQFDYLWTHALISDETHAAIDKYCDFSSSSVSEECDNSMTKAYEERGKIDWYNIYGPICHDTSLKNGSVGSVYNYDPCSDHYVDAYLNNPEVQRALHAIPTNWTHCRNYSWTDELGTVLPTVEYLIANGSIRLWMYSGDTDSVVPVTASRRAINSLKLAVEVPWRAWYYGNEVGGYVEQYKGLILVTVRGAGHTVPSWQPARALTLITSFLKHSLPPASPWP